MDAMKGLDAKKDKQYAMADRAKALGRDRLFQDLVGKLPYRIQSVADWYPLIQV